LNNLGSSTPLEMHAAAHSAAQLVHTQLQVIQPCPAACGIVSVGISCASGLPTGFSHD
jgi:hypothetical protein